ncbi:hypothetical protein DER45DRAFT_561870 [Fusarium avenaceum]|nr:hypothetical protein DER45DRAFT_561870 [Fusarium avenaceum]
MRIIAVVLAGFTTVAKASSVSVASPIASTESLPMVVPIPAPVAQPIVPGFTRPEDVQAVIRRLNGLASGVFLQVDNFGGSGIKVQVIWNAYLRCRDMIDGIERAFNGISHRHTNPFGFKEQRDICSMFDSFGINQSKLVTVLVKDSDFIATSGFAKHFGHCFARLRPAMIKFIEELTTYTPNCDLEMLRRKDQLEVSYGGAVGIMEDHHEGSSEHIPLPLD